VFWAFFTANESDDVVIALDMTALITVLVATPVAPGSGVWLVAVSGQESVEVKTAST
jgi:hypothetical protein